MTEKLTSLGLSPWGGKPGASSHGKRGPSDHSLSNNAIGKVLFDLIPLLVKVIQTNNIKVSDILGRAACSQLNNATNWVFTNWAKLLPTFLGEMGLPGRLSLSLYDKFPFIV